jgi:magnesium chelatase family protein
MLARRRTTLRPAMTLAETLDATRVAGRTGDRTACVTTRPCRAPHHTISEVGLIGGGHGPLPGEGSRAHHGVRWLDARPECRRHVLEVLRQPLEEGVIYLQSPARHRPRRAGCDRRSTRDTNQIAGTMVVPDKDALAEGCPRLKNSC